MPKQTGVLFDERFLDLHAGSIISDSSVAVVELVANAWDAYATQVDISWPRAGSGHLFSIRDNGKGMTAAQFDVRWRKLDYNKPAEEGSWVDPPEELKTFPRRRAYGRNGRGRHAAFRFSNPYLVRTWREGVELTYAVRRGITQPFDIKQISSRKGIEGHGTEIIASAPSNVALSADEAREIVGTRFLADPNFKVSIDGTRISFDDLSAIRLKEIDVPVAPYGTAHLAMIDALKADRTTKQHGIAWRVAKRLVGTPGWVGFEHERILDGRTSEAKRFQFIVSADYLEPAILADWSAFDQGNAAWQATRPAVHSAINDLLSTFTAEKRSDVKATVKQHLGRTVSKLAPAGRDRWVKFVDTVVDSCPGISTNHIEQVAGILANLELTTSKYGLVDKLHAMPPGDLDQLHQLLVDWTVRTAKIALDEIQTRLKLISELDLKLRDKSLEEVADLQPLFERSLWVFGPEFESIEFTSNKGMTEVIRKLFGAATTGTRNRPDFVMVPDGSVGFYSRDSHDLGHEVDGVSRLVVAEIKKVGVTIGGEQKEQAWKYVKELIREGHLTDGSQVTCFVLGSKVDETENSDSTHWDNRVRVRPMTYSVFIRRAEKRMLGLREKLRDAPFLKDHGIDAAEYVTPHLFQEELDLPDKSGPAKAGSFVVNGDAGPAAGGRD